MTYWSKGGLIDQRRILKYKVLNKVYILHYIIYLLKLNDCYVI